jgi:hypothetical protein
VFLRNSLQLKHVPHSKELKHNANHIDLVALIVLLQFKLIRVNLVVLKKVGLIIP